LTNPAIRLVGFLQRDLLLPPACVSTAEGMSSAHFASIVVDNRNLSAALLRSSPPFCASLRAVLQQW
jgi:hypothetical protein